VLHSRIMTGRGEADRLDLLQSDWGLADLHGGCVDLAATGAKPGFFGDRNPSSGQRPACQDLQRFNSRGRSDCASRIDNGDFPIVRCQEGRD
jgi:hypothetical protein